MMKWQKMSAKARWVSLGSIVIALILLIIGVFALRAHQRQNDAGKQVTQAITKSADLDRKINDHWVQPNVYITANTTSHQVTALTAQSAALTKQVAPYRKNARRTVANQLKQFDAAATKRKHALKLLRRATQATERVNALTKPKALQGKQVNSKALIKAGTNQAKIAKATETIATSSAILKHTLTRVLATCTTQLKERTALVAATAKIASAGKLKANPNYEDLAAYLTFIKQMKYPGLADHQKKLTAAATKALASMNIKGISEAELQRRIFYVYSDGKAADAAYLDTANGMTGFSGDTYTADIWGNYVDAAGPSSHELATISVALNGDYTMTHDATTVKTGNLLKDVSAAQLKTVRADVTKGKEPKEKALTDLFPTAQNFYDWAIGELDPREPGLEEMHTNTTAEFSVTDEDGNQDDLSFDAQYDFIFGYTNKYDNGTDGFGHFGCVVLAKDDTVYSGMPMGMIEEDPDLTASVMAMRYSD